MINVGQDPNCAKIIFKNALSSLGRGKTVQNSTFLGCFYPLWVFEG